jgi:hypothetical protein
MALVIETGAVVAGANSYISVTDAKAYAAARGLTLPATDSAIEVLLIKAMDYIESFRAEFQGLKTDKDNPCQWPRSGVVVDSFDVEEDEIPDLLPKAQAQLAVHAYTQELMPVSDGREVVKERIEGAVEVNYAPLGDTAPQPWFPVAQALLDPLLDGGGMELEVVRV